MSKGPNHRSTLRSEPHLGLWWRSESRDSGRSERRRTQYRPSHGITHVPGSLPPSYSHERLLDHSDTSSARADGFGTEAGEAAQLYDRHGRGDGSVSHEEAS